MKKFLTKRYRPERHYMRGRGPMWLEKYGGGIDGVGLVMDDHRPVDINVLGFFASGIFSGMGAFLTENFPTRVRGSGQGFAYNFGRGVAALNPFFVGVLSATLPLGQSIGIFAVIAYGILIVAALLLPETKGRVLTADA